MRNVFKKFGLLAPLVVLSACGGGGGGGGSANQASKVVSANVTVALPAGYTAPSRGLSLSGGLFPTSPMKGTSGTAQIWNSGRELVGVLDSKGNPLLLGWIGDGVTTINTRTTADVLTYFAIEGYAAPAQNQDALVAAISQQSGGDRVSSDIATDLTAGRNLGSTGVAFAADLKALALSLVSAGSGASVAQALKPSAVTSDPTTVQSGVSLTMGTNTDSFTATNTFRRRVLMFVDRSDTFDGATPPVTTPAAISVTQMEIAPGGGGVNSASVVSNLGTSNQPATTQSITLPTVPSPQFGATYDVITVGAGASNTAPSTLDTTELAAKDTFLKKSFFLDFFLPVLNRICISNTLTQTQMTQAGLASLASQMDTAAANQQAGVAGFIDTNFPNAETQMENGDFLGATNSVVATLNGNASTYAAMVQYYATFLQSAIGGNTNFPANSGTVGAVTLWMSSALKNVDISSLPISLPQYQGVAQSTEYSTWKLTQTTGAVVSLTPATSTVTTTPGSDTANLTASVNFGAAGQPTGSTIQYSWTTTGAHGDLVFPNTTGTTSEPNSAYDTTEYFADIVNLNNSGTDTVTVTATLVLANKSTKQLGSATASVTVSGQNTTVTWPAFYALRTSSGAPVAITGGSWGALFVHGLANVFVQSTILGHLTSSIMDNAGPLTGGGTGSYGELALTNKYAGATGGEVDAVSGDTVTITFFDQDSDTGYPGSPSIGIAQDIHLYSPTNQDLGVVISKFTSTVGDSQGAYDNGSGGDWVVTKTFTLP